MKSAVATPLAAFARHRELCTTAKPAAELVEVPSVAMLMIDGTGKPEASPVFQEAIQALFGTAYGLKFDRKKRKPELDFHVPPVEGLWGDEEGHGAMPEDISTWAWTLMLAVPDDVTLAEVDAVRAALEKRGRGSAMLTALRLERFAEGRCAQLLHIGSYEDEERSIRALLDFIAAQGLHPAGRHHEIYIGDPRRADPSKLKTVLRMPVA